MSIALATAPIIVIRGIRSIILSKMNLFTDI